MLGRERERESGGLNAGPNLTGVLIFRGGFLNVGWGQWALVRPLDSSSRQARARPAWFCLRQSGGDDDDVTKG